VKLLEEKGKWLEIGRIPNLGHSVPRRSEFPRNYLPEVVVRVRVHLIYLGANHAESHAPLMIPVRRYFKLYAALWKNSVAREMSFKGNFILWIVVELLWFGLQLAFVSVVFSQTQSVGTWSKWQMVLLVGASNFIQQLYQAFFLTNCTNLSELVRTGRLDFLLLLPVNTRFLVSLRAVDLGAFVNAMFGLSVMVYAAAKLNLHPGPAQLAGFGALCVVGVLIHYSLMFILATVCFWTVRAQGIVWGYYNLFNIARMPDEAFRGVFKVAFTFCLPVLLVSNVPVRILADKIVDPRALLSLFVIGVAWALVSEYFWRFSIRRYTSASS
jgi:ABC-2 type transport system permease protein